MIDARKQDPEADDEQDDALGEVGHDDGGLAAGDDVDGDEHGGDGRAGHDVPSEQALEHLAEGEQVDADVGDEVGEDDAHGGDA